MTEKQVLDAIDRGNHAGGPTGRFWALDPIDGTKGETRPAAARRGREAGPRQGAGSFGHHDELHSGGDSLGRGRCRSRLMPRPTLPFVAQDSFGTTSMLWRLASLTMARCAALVPSCPKSQAFRLDLGSLFLTRRSATFLS